MGDLWRDIVDHINKTDRLNTKGETMQPVKSAKQAFKAEPVAILAAVRLGILCAVAFGLGWTVEQIAAVMAFVEAIMAIFTRSQVNRQDIDQ